MNNISLSCEQFLFIVVQNVCFDYFTFTVHCLQFTLFIVTEMTVYTFHLGRLLQNEHQK